MKTKLDKHLKAVFHKRNLQTVESAVGETDEAQKAMWELFCVQTEHLKNKTWQS